MSVYPHFAISEAISDISAKTDELYNLMAPREDNGYGLEMTSDELSDLVEVTARLMRLINRAHQED